MQNNLKPIFGGSHGLDPKSIDFLTNALAKSNLPGFDYLEFKLAMTKLSEMQMDESTAIKSAFATAQTVGLTKTKLIDTANHYKNVLQKEHDQFGQALENQIQKKVAGKQKEVEKLKAQINKHMEKINQLQAQVDQYQATIDGADQEIMEAKSKIETTKDGFEHTHQSILNQIDKDIQSFNKYL